MVVLPPRVTLDKLVAPLVDGEKDVGRRGRRGARVGGAGVVGAEVADGSVVDLAELGRRRTAGVKEVVVYRHDDIRPGQKKAAHVEIIGRINVEGAGPAAGAADHGVVVSGRERSGISLAKRVGARRGGGDDRSAGIEDRQRAGQGRAGVGDAGGQTLAAVVGHEGHGPPRCWRRRSSRWCNCRRRSDSARSNWPGR